MREAQTPRPKDYKWRSEEVELISAILGAAQSWRPDGAEAQGPRGEREDGAPRRPALPAPSARPVQADQLSQASTRVLNRLVEQLIEELRNQRGEIRELRGLIGQAQPVPQLPPPHHHRHSWWCKLRHARSNRHSLSA